VWGILFRKEWSNYTLVFVSVAFAYHSPEAFRFDNGREGGGATRLKTKNTAIIGEITYATGYEHLYIAPAGLDGTGRELGGANHMKGRKRPPDDARRSAMLQVMSCGDRSSRRDPPPGCQREQGARSEGDAKTPCPEKGGGEGGDCLGASDLGFRLF
jgi:hypothetical protein